MRCRRVHFVGVGGVGMSGLAELLMNLGYKVSGSDAAESETTRRLASLGVKVFRGHSADQARDVDVLVYSSAVAESNPEVAAARERQIPVIRRAEMLAELMRMKYGVAVAGAHGKTTTTSLVAAVLAEGGLDPTTIVGGRVNQLGTNAHLGTGDYLVAEADESDGSFLRLVPTVTVVTNIDAEHLDHYGSFEAVREAFREFIHKVPFYGFSVLCADDGPLRDLIPQVARKVVTYGLEEGADYTAREVEPHAEGMSFVAHHGSRRLGRVRIRLRGRHNVSNAMAAVAVGTEFGIGFESVRRALESFRGIHRRFEHVGEANGIAVVDDYGHHPREIQAVLAAARGAWPKRRILVVFQPHRYTRTQSLLTEFFGAFDEADRVGVLPIYAAGETPIEGVDARRIFEGVRTRGTVAADFLEGLEEAQSFLLDAARPGDLVITLGAGDVWKVAPGFLKRLGEAGGRVVRSGRAPAAGGEAA
ncbi:MAG: UDP-N-acetylmuramate--L-alanine ligase [Candidatus Tectomicrobia bacterium]|nr:UDP-N-acetylmuramate--L-alanine ligase [Candidatus Tectomicrobia bacterium]